MDLALSSTPSPSSLFVPAFRPAVCFEVTLSEGVSGLSGWGGEDEDFCSDFTGTTFAFSLVVGAAEGGGAAVVVLDGGAFRVGFSWGNRERIVDDTINFTMRLGFEPLPERTAAGGVASLDSEDEARRREVVDLVFAPMVCGDRLSCVVGQGVKVHTCSPEMVRNYGLPEMDGCCY